MAYGDNRTEVTSDAFGSSIDSDWSNGEGDYETLSWATGGYVQPSASFGEPAMRHSGHTFADDQYSSVTVQAFDGSASEIWAMVRMQGGTDESCYAGVNTASGNQFKIHEISSSLGITELTSTNTDPDNPTAGDILTMECEGTTLRYGDDINGSDAQRLSTTDNTITSGEPGLLVFSASTTSLSRVTAWSGGDIEPPADKTATGAPSIILPTSSGTAKQTLKGTGAPSVILPTSAGDAKQVLKSSGAPSLALITSAGDAAQTLHATGAPSIILPESSGAATVAGNKTAAGAPEVILPTSSGVAKQTLKGSGSPVLTLITSSGGATVTGASSVVITDVSTDETWNDGESGIPITGTGFV